MYSSTWLCSPTVYSSPGDATRGTVSSSQIKPLLRQIITPVFSKYTKWWMLSMFMFYQWQLVFFKLLMLWEHKPIFIILIPFYFNLTGWRHVYLYDNEHDWNRSIIQPKQPLNVWILLYIARIFPPKNYTIKTNPD